jgi:hypothetical protein
MMLGRNQMVRVGALLWVILVERLNYDEIKEDYYGL